MADNSSLTERGILGIFFDALESALGDSWAGSISLEIPSDAESMTHRWLGQAPAMREWVSGVILKAIRNRTLTITNKLYEASTEVNVDDLRRDKTGQLRVKAIDDLGATSSEHWEELITTDVIEGNPVCYDSQNFFDTDHPIEESGGTQKNALVAADVGALNVVDTTAVTKAEAIAIILALVTKFYGLKTDRNRPANGRARRFMLMTPVAQMAIFASAIADALNPNGGTNELRGQQFTVDLQVNPWLTSDSVLYMFRMDATRSKPVIMQSETDPMVTTIDDEREKKLHRRVSYHVESWRAAAPGEYRQAIKATLS